LTTPAIEARGVSKAFDARKVLDNIDIHVESGSIFGFLGPNGAGKTTAIRILLGLMTPDSAEVEIFGKDLFTDRDQIVRQVGAIVESPVFFEYLTAFENLRYLASLSGPVGPGKILKALETVGLAEVADRKVKTFSFGMKQRLGIAQALLPENRLIFLDEPTNGLDPHGIMDMRRLLRQLRDELGITIFLSSHLLVEVEQVCDHVCIINHGVKVKEAKVSDLLELQDRVELCCPESDQAKVLSLRLKQAAEHHCSHGKARFLLAATEPDIPALARALVAADVSILKLAKHKKTLEDIFVELTAKPQTAPAAAGL